MEAVDGLRILAGAANVGAVRREGRYLLIGSAEPDWLRSQGVHPGAVEWVLLTHHHRTAAPGLADLLDAGARLAVPEAERALFDAPETFWADDARRNHTYDFHPCHLTLREGVAVARTLREGEPFVWRGLTIKVLRAPGPSAGSVALVVEEGGRRTAFVGELMAGPGRLRDFHLLQGRRRFAGGELVEYHGFGERAADSVRSLERVLDERPDTLVGSFGRIAGAPAAAVGALRQRLEAVRRNYHAISAGRWYFPTAWPDVADITADLRKRLRPLPAWVMEVGGTSRAVVAEDGSALLVDCAGDVPQRIRALRAAGRIGPVERLWITHYHDDHVEHVLTFRDAERCEVIAHRTMADILQRPEAYQMPCLDPRPIVPDRVTSEGETRTWRGFALTAFDLPGQSIYDAALLVEREGQRVLFVGDTFTPGGLDDYCALNRNLLGPGQGYDRCLELLAKLGADTLLVNEHVGGAFVFSAAEVAHMRRVLDERRALFADLLDWPDPNFGLDPQWARLDPYYRRLSAARSVEWTVVLRNHARTRKRFSVRLRCPSGWRPAVESAEVSVKGGKEGRVTVAAEPASVARARSVFGLEVAMDGRNLGEIAEAIVDVR
jgi:glyoxylase-like metal-dependent hydrolase (beta-lactamase superfamily II)